MGRDTDQRRGSGTDLAHQSEQDVKGASELKMYSRFNFVVPAHGPIRKTVGSFAEEERRVNKIVTTIRDEDDGFADDGKEKSDKRRFEQERRKGEVSKGKRVKSGQFLPEENGHHRWDLRLTLVISAPHLSS